MLKVNIDIKTTDNIFVHFIKYIIMPDRHTYFLFSNDNRKSNGRSQPGNSI